MNTRLMCIFGIETVMKKIEKYMKTLSINLFFFRYIVKMCSVTQSCSTP